MSDRSKRKKHKGQHASAEATAQLPKAVWCSILSHLQPRQMHSLRLAASSLQATIDSCRPADSLTLDCGCDGPLAPVATASNHFNRRLADKSNLYPWLTTLSIINGARPSCIMEWMYFALSKLTAVTKFKIEAEVETVQIALGTMSLQRACPLEEISITVLLQDRQQQMLPPPTMSSLFQVCEPPIYSSLRRLHLSGVSVDGSRLARLARQLRHLRWAVLDHRLNDGAQPARFTNMGKLSQLTSLDLHLYPASMFELEEDESFYDPADFAAVQKMLRQLPSLHNNLCALHLTSRCLSCQDLKVLSRLTGLSNLELTFEREVPDGTPYLLRTLQPALQRLQQLIVPCLTIHTATLRAFAKSTQLTLLSCQNISASDADTKAGITPLPLPQLDNLLVLKMRSLWPAQNLPHMFPALTCLECPVSSTSDARKLRSTAMQLTGSALVPRAGAWSKLRTLHISSLCLQAATSEVFAHCTDVSLQQAIGHGSDGKAAATGLAKELAAAAEKMPAVQHLRLQQWTGAHVADAVLTRMCGVWKGLLAVELIGLDALTDAGMAALLPLQSLRKVQLEACPLITTRSITAHTACPSLRDVVVLDCSQVAAAACYSLFNQKRQWRLNVVVEMRRAAGGMEVNEGEGLDVHGEGGGELSIQRDDGKEVLDEVLFAVDPAESDSDDDDDDGDEEEDAEVLLGGNHIGSESDGDDGEEEEAEEEEEEEDDEEEEEEEDD